MSVAIIIGFQYTSNDLMCYTDNSIPKDKYYLPAVRKDIITVYNYCKRKNYSKILVITDIVCDSRSKTDEGRLIETLTKNGEYYPYKNKQELFNLIAQNYNHQRILFYFTGHGKPGKFILPDGLIMQNEFNFLLVNKTDFIRDIMVILDCCNGDSPLPFVFVPGEKTSFYRYNNSRFHTNDRVICMTSCTNNQIAMTTFNGSLFTRSLFDALEKETSILTIYRRVMDFCTLYYEQKMMIYSSQPNMFNI